MKPYQENEKSNGKKGRPNVHILIRKEKGLLKEEFEDVASKLGYTVCVYRDFGSWSCSIESSLGLSLAVVEEFFVGNNSQVRAWIKGKRKVASFIILGEDGNRNNDPVAAKQHASELECSVMFFPFDIEEVRKALMLADYSRAHLAVTEENRSGVNGSGGSLFVPMPAEEKLFSISSEQLAAILLDSKITSFLERVRSVFAERRFVVLNGVANQEAAQWAMMTALMSEWRGGSFFSIRGEDFTPESMERALFGGPTSCSLLSLITPGVVFITGIESVGGFLQRRLYEAATKRYAYVDCYSDHRHEYQVDIGVIGSSRAAVYKEGITWEGLSSSIIEVPSFLSAPLSLIKA